MKRFWLLILGSLFWVFIAGLTVSATTADEEPPVTLGDVVLRLESLEAWRSTVERSTAPALPEIRDYTSSSETFQRPTLEVSSADWCGPCQRFKADIQGKDLPVEVKWVRWAGAPNQIPAFRYKDKAGIQRVKVGYAPGEWKIMLADMGLSQ